MVRCTFRASEDPHPVARLRELKLGGITLLLAGIELLRPS